MKEKSLSDKYWNEWSKIDIDKIPPKEEVNNDYLKGWVDGKKEITVILNKKLKQSIKRLKEDMIVPIKGDRVGFVINEYNKRIKEIFGDKLV